MSAKLSKQLGALLSRVPPATAAGQGANPAPRSVPYAPALEPTPLDLKAEPIAVSDREVPLHWYPSMS